MSDATEVDPAVLHPLARLPEDWEVVLARAGEPRFRARQVFRWLHAQGEHSPTQMTNLPRPLRQQLTSETLDVPAAVGSVHRAEDGTRKIVLELDGARVECVLIPMSRSVGEAEDADLAALPDDDDDVADDAPRSQRVTLCLSTQYGCAMGCVFCASGRAGLVRGLRAEEIVAQVQIARRHLEPGEHLRNLVFMGMGEPLHHYDETVRALRVLTHADGLDLSPRRITVSTVGLVPGIRRLGRDFAGKIGLAVSLHAPNDAVRAQIVPMNQRYSVADILAALAEYPLPRRRRITIEYTLIAGVNDRPEHAEELGRVLRRLRVKVNLIPMNAVAGAALEGSPPERVAEFRERVARAGLSCFVRVRRGDDVSAACGQLAYSGPLVDPARLRGVGRAAREP